MIYDAHRWRAAERCSALVSHLSAAIGSVCGEQVLGNAQNIGELAAAVDDFLRRRPGKFVEADHLILMASQALAALGEKQAARRLVVLGTGLVRPSEWTVIGEASAWVLDLKRMTVRADAALELVFFAALDMVLECAGELWDGASGRGTLGLRHVCAAARALLGAERQGKNSEALAGEIMAACRDKLARIGAARRWRHVPDVMNLDLA
ncbi:MAG: hypothetical protein QME60_00290 [Verrucomicrobiota bacterium]|nr:hypothetical protein [Verrucomicrobiota bacterium]